MNVDPFGHAGALPQVLAGQGMHAYCFLRPMAHEKALPSALFRWRGPDGTEVLGFRIPFEYQSSRESVDRHIEKALAELDDRLPETMVFFGVGNHGGGPTIAQIETVHRFDRMGSFGACRCRIRRRTSPGCARSASCRTCRWSRATCSITRRAATPRTRASSCGSAARRRRARRGAVGGRRRDRPG